MVKHINIPIDDDLADRAIALKNSRDWTWEDLIRNAIEEFEDVEHTDNDPSPDG